MTNNLKSILTIVDLAKIIGTPSQGGGVSIIAYSSFGNEKKVAKMSMYWHPCRSSTIDI